MPYCTSCGEHFRGRGSYCALHDSSYFTRTDDHHHRYANNNHYTYPDSAYKPTIKYRTAGQHHHRPLHRSTSTSRLHDYDYTSTNALIPYDTNHTYTSNALTTREPNTYTYSHDHNHNHSHPHRATNLSPHALATTFSALTTTHAITSLTVSLSPTGTHTLTATANRDREQCPCCLTWFPDAQKLRWHAYEAPVRCEVHGVCLREDGEEVAWHARSARHERCFVGGCKGVYRREGGWKEGVVERHVLGWHG
ncbi:hypothetical protein BDV95DRAFT_494025 [Massariosphaeria phaeospora]|uniref:Uncharacterized protein n=1 Tax=Massariosphaeria phaeospora TaxID=100035 RepID=A0A7C8IDZ5_9PLEO|nr:hypothetical protein BDV95DRAFT_494025 [Massariosphaeria phaeospora]